MSLPIKVSADTRAMTAALRRKLAGVPRAASAGINRTLARAETFAVRQIQANAGASAQKTIRRNIGVIKASATKPEGELRAVSARKHRIPIYELKPRPRTRPKRRTGLGVRWGKQGRLIPHSFIATVKAGSTGTHTGVFARTGDFTKTGKPQIVEQFGPSVALIFSRRAIQRRVIAFIRELLPKETTKALKHFGS